MSDAPQAGVLTFADAARVLAAQPFSVLLGTRVSAFGDAAATLELDIRDDLKQQNGYLHGGVLAYAADNAITFAGGSVLGPDVLTGGFTIDYFAPARGRVLLARARVIHAGRRRAGCACELLTVDEDGNQTPCAAAQGTVIAARRAR